MTAESIINKAKLLADDTDNDRYTNAEYLDFLNDILSDLSSELKCYVRDGAIAICEEQFVYDLPEDVIELLTIHQDFFDSGAVVYGESYNSQLYRGVNATGASSVNADNSAASWGFPTNSFARASTRVSMRDISSNDQIAVSPSFSAEESIYYNGEVWN